MKRSEIHQLATATRVLCFFWGGSFEVKDVMEKDWDFKMIIFDSCILVHFNHELPMNSVD